MNVCIAPIILREPSFEGKSAHIMYYLHTQMSIRDSQSFLACICQPDTYPNHHRPSDQDEYDHNTAYLFGSAT